MRMLLLSSLNRTGNAQEPLRLLAHLPPDDLLLPNTGMFDMVIGTLAAKPLSWAGISTRHLRHVKPARSRRPTNGNGLPPRLGFVSWPAMLPAHNLTPRKRELLEARLREHPQDFRSLRALSWVYLALNRKTDAIRVAQQALELLPPEKDAVLGSGNLAALAQIQAHTGAATEAVQNLKKLLSIPAGETLISIARLKIDPVWDPILQRPGFQQLLAGKERVGP